MLPRWTPCVLPALSPQASPSPLPPPLPLPLPLTLPLPTPAGPGEQRSRCPSAQQVIGSFDLTHTHTPRSLSLLCPPHTPSPPFSPVPHGQSYERRRKKRAVIRSRQLPSLAQLSFHLLCLLSLVPSLLFRTVPLFLCRDEREGLSL